MFFKAGVIIILVALLGLGQETAFAGQKTVQVTRGSSSLQAGSYLTAGAKLKKGESVDLRVEEADGRVCQLNNVKGPYSDSVFGGAITLFQSVRCAAKQRRAHVSRVDVSKIDLGEDEFFCFKSAEKPALAREDAKQPEELVIRHEKTGDADEEPYIWPGGESVLPWPHEEFPVKNGAVYWISFRGKLRSLGFYQIPVGLSETEEKVFRMAKRCRGGL